MVIDKSVAIGHANTDPFFLCLRRIGYEPTHILDVGAHTGAWTRSALRYFPNAHYSLFEPQKDLLESQIDLASNPKVDFHFVAMGPRCGTGRMTSCPRRDSFSLRLSESEATKLGLEQFDVNIMTIDQFVIESKERLHPPEMIKIDAEGWDLEVVQGSESSLSDVEVVLLEAGVMNKNFKNTAREVINFMSDRCFTLFDITDLNRTKRDNGLWNVELAFVRKGGRLEAAIGDYE